MNRRILSMALVLIVLCTLLPQAVMAAGETSKSTYPPYTEVSYGYEAEVQCGTIRYVSQIVGSAEYHYDYWKEWEWKRIPGLYNGPVSECGTACISMALSYVGVNKTPKDILDYGNGRTYFIDWGDASVNRLPVEEFTAAVDNYLNGNGRYSPPVIHLPNYSAKGHFVLVIGKIDEETYEVLDPNNQAVKQMTIIGNMARYVRNGVTITDWIDGLSQWFNPNSAPAIIQKTYPSACVVKTTEQIYAMTLPCNSDMIAESMTLCTFDRGQHLNVTELILNDRDEYWYKVQLADKSICYVPASKTEYQKDSTGQITISGEKSPTYLQQGNYFSLKGKISSQNSRLVGVSVYVRKGHGENGEIMTSGSVTLNSKVFELSGSQIDSAVRFGRLAQGPYTYIVEANYISYYVVDGTTLTSNAGSVILQDVHFTVEEPYDKNPPDQPTLQVGIVQDQAVFFWEDTGHTTHYHVLIQKRNPDDTWEDVERIKYTSSGVIRALPYGEYRAQVIAYNENAWNNDTNDWQQTASEAMQFVIKCEHSYDEGVLVKDPTCKDDGAIRYTCTLCGHSNVASVPKLTTHVPGATATATTDQVCTVCDVVLEAATGVTEPEQTVPPQPTEPAEDMQHSGIGTTIVTIVLLIVLGCVATGIVLVERRRLAETTKEKQETQS